MIDAGEIKALGRDLGIDEIRITTAEPFSEALARFKNQENGSIFSQQRYKSLNNIISFFDVRSKLPGARSIIAACQCYLTDETPDLTKPGKPYGRIARYTWRNHYLDLKERLKKLARRIKEKYNINYCVYSNGPVAEKPIARRSGLGYYGKHSIIINPAYGSWIVLGELITDIEIEPDPPLSLDCGDCNKCIEACPTNAIIRPFVIDRSRCIQELTNWYGIIPDDIARVWENRLYGCITCQEVCPKNRNVKPREPRTDIGYVGSSLPLLTILKMDEKEYRMRFPRNQITASWIDFRAIQRNALLCLGNLRDKTTIPILKEYAVKSDPVFSRTASWALSNF
ncbi:MAG TPA: tRNA epoxyqueuosine(34) reductase QueG [candidate division WOR-3 bacterium]|uniref:tRNA epoxyqueuosine(34) reductase QueG n=1 Tax=candidate division WOR-3 bacterium TaxID=2052148 RepID=A0A9C9EMP2_UNCW3|nr:tRNA epoxyqueuosine(34) reductase QueG [candidate division WOR-3 bacterium]